jgi:hypothetical protein
MFSRVRVQYEKAVTDLVRGLSAAQLLGSVVASAQSGKVVPAIPIKLEKSSLNHYSPKYNKFFVTFTYVTTNNTETHPGLARHPCDLHLVLV